MSINLKNYQQKKRKPPGISLGDWLNKDIRLFGQGLALKKKEAFYTELEILLTAGLDIQSALELIEEGGGKKNDQQLFQNIKEMVVNGSSLSQALKATAQFTDYEIFSLQIGEESGRLTTVLKELALFFNKSLKYRRQLTAALSYPIFVSLFAFGAVFFLLNYLVPLFSSIYDRFEGELPPITQVIIAISDWLGKYSGWGMLAVGSIFLALYLQRKKIWFRKWGAALVLRIPLLGGILKKIYLARFCQSMNLLLLSKVPLLKCVELVAKMIAFYPLEIALRDTSKAIMNGQSLNESLRKFPFFPPSMLALLKVGEEASNLDLMFEKLASQYNEEIDQASSTIGSLLEPVLIIGLGILVALILVAMYLPLFQLSTSFGI